MKRLFSFLLLIYASTGFAQSGKYIVFEERPPFDTVRQQDYKLLYNHIRLAHSSGKPGLEILNLYFSKNNFKSSELDGKSFSEGAVNSFKLVNNVLITLTPLCESAEIKMTKVPIPDISKMAIFKPEELLQEALKNLYRCFTENDVQHDVKPGIIKTLKYKLLIKKGNVFYTIKVPILTEYYLIDKASYLYPTQYHYGEINVQKREFTTYVSGQDIFDMLRQHISSTTSNYYPIRAVSRRTYLGDMQLNDHCNIYSYWTYPGFPNGMMGIGKFQFIEGIGVINGTYPTYFDKNFTVDTENNPAAVLEDFNGLFTQELKTINGISLKQYCEKLNKPAKAGQIIPAE